MGTRGSADDRHYPGPGRGLHADDRAFSETFAVGVLVGLTVFMAVTAGFYVVAVQTDENDADAANFSYDYSADGDELIVRYVEGETFPADRVVVESDRHEVRWTELAGSNVNGTLEPGAVVLLNSRSDWGRPVTGVSTISIQLETNESRRELSNWTAD